MCNCKSYNLNIGEEPSVILTPPENLFKQMDRDTRSICIDKCIANVIKHLWNHNIVTLGSCCGHNEKSPSVVIANYYLVSKVRNLIREVDDRRWVIWVWETRLVGYPEGKGMEFSVIY